MTKTIEFIFHSIIAVLALLNIFDFVRPGNLIYLQLINAATIVMLGYMIFRLSYKLAHIPVQEKYIKPSRRRRRV